MIIKKFGILTHSVKIIAGLLVIILFFGCNNLKNKEEKMPNIIFILADDLGYGDVSCFNEYAKISTPNIDRLGKEGVLFTDAHTSSAVCTPTRYGIMTGRYNWRSTLKKGVLSGYSKALIPQERKTIAKLLHENGYNTAGIGKWHLGWDWANVAAGTDSIDYSQKVQNGPATLGFEYFFGFCGSLDMPPYVWVQDDMPTMLPVKETVNNGKQSWWRKGPTSDDFEHEQVLPLITEKTINYITEHAKKEDPFFVYMPLSAPHTPILPTNEFKEKSGLENPYADFVIMVDAMVGKVMSTLESQGISDNTILIFTSDNGCSPQADFEQLVMKGHDPSYVFRGHKADIFEGGHRVPYIFRWPAKVKPGKSDQLICTTDLFATVADILQISYSDNVAEDSYSYMSALNLESKATVRTSIVHHSINGSFAYRKNEWKAIYCPGSGGWSDPRPNSPGIEKLPKFQLYNLNEDIAEENNLQDQKPEILIQYKEELSHIILSGRSTEGTPQKNDGPETWPEIEFLNQ